MHHAQIAQRAFNTPLMVNPAKALAFLSGLGLRITGQEITFAGVDLPSGDVDLAALPARASLFGTDLARRHQQGGAQPFAMIDGIAVIEIAGTLVHRGAWIGQSSGLTSYEGIAAQLQAAVADPGVRGIALDIDSFGGEVAGAFDLADRIRAARVQKPVHAFVAEHALSAGYVLAPPSGAARLAEAREGCARSYNRREMSDGGAVWQPQDPAIAAVEMLRIQGRRHRRDRPLLAVRFMAERCGAASPYRPFVDRAAFHVARGQQRERSCRLANSSYRESGNARIIAYPTNE